MYRVALLALLLSVGLAGCATLPNGKADPRDRFERVNRSVYKFNTAVDHAVLRPAARGVEVMPSDKTSFGGAIGHSLAMRSLFGVLERIAPTDATVLLEGETGSGKDVLARAICAQSPRASKPFVVVDCGAVSYSLIESELFGHERGAFTGAVATRQGAFELADGGTVFLDEIGELPPGVQMNLLGALERRRIRRLGGRTDIPIDVRIVRENAIPLSQFERDKSALLILRR